MGAATGQTLTMDHYHVAQLIVDCVDETVRPRFRSLTEGEIEEKAPGDLVTIADRECEVQLTGLLRSVSDVPVVGEEAAAANPHLVNLIDSSPAVWIVDPVDGTSNFANGNPDYAAMVAYAVDGETTAAWIWRPEQGTMLMASKGAGATINGEPLRLPPSKPVRGVLKDKFMPADISLSVRASLADFEIGGGSGCAGVEYQQVAQGDIDFLVYWRTNPWDHAPGALIVSEAGGKALRPDGSGYRSGTADFGIAAGRPVIVNRIVHAQQASD